MSTEPAILAEGLHYRYRRAAPGQPPALDGLSFAVRPGEVYGLLGPNGAGKSTAVKILATILTPDLGRACIAGHDTVTGALAARRQLAAVLQENAVETMLTVRDNLLLYGRLHGFSNADSGRLALPVIEQMELGEQLDKRAQELSGGMKRRLQVAKALMIPTPVLFLDEATTGMDPLIKRRTMEAIKAQAAAGRTVLLTTQLLDEAEVLCQRMALVKAGKCVAEGTLAELRRSARSIHRIALRFVNQDEEAVAALRELAPTGLTLEGDEWVVSAAGGEDVWIRRMAQLSERWPLAHLEIRGASLEQIFFDIYSDEKA